MTDPTASTETARSWTGAMCRALRHPSYRRLLAALTVSQAGDWLYNVALLVLVLDRTHSASWVAATTAARVLPIVVLGPIGGVLADRFDRRRLMVASDAVRALAMLLLALTAAAGLPVLLAPVLAAVATAAATPYPPCVAVATPRLVPGRDLAGANAARSAVGALCIVVGPALGGALLLVGSPTTAFLVNAATFMLSALLVLTLPVSALGRTEPSTTRPRLVAELLDGLAALRASSPAVRLVGADVMCSLVYGAETVLLLLLSRSLGHGATGYGWLLAGTGMGGLLGTVAATRAADARHPRAVLVAALLALAVPLPLLAVVRSLPAAVALSALGGAGAIVIEVMTDTGLQRLLDERVLGRVYGIALPAALSGIVVGSLVAAPLVAVLGLRGALLALGALVIAYALVMAAPRVPGAGLEAVPSQTLTTTA
jgi:MFS family permease